MKKLFLSLFILALGIPVLYGCSADTHYDSVSSDISINIAPEDNDGEPVVVRQRFQFDRDLTTVSSMTLYEAWLSSPTAGPRADREEVERIDDSYTLDIVKSISVSIVENDEDTEQKPVFWMMIPSSDLHHHHALFSEFNIGDLRAFMDKYQQLEVEINIALEPYYAMKYWRDICSMSDTCTVTLPFSMQFKMED